MTFSPISVQSPLILASASPRRKRLLKQIGLPFRVMTGHVNEHSIDGDPENLCRILAGQKACQVRSKAKKSWILGADTLVVIDNKVLGKPEGDEQATHMLRLLSGKEHRVITGFCILNPSGAVARSESVTTLVRIKKLSDQEIKAYMRTGEPYGKAGGYAIQGIGSFMVEAISGSYTNVVGLPLCAVIKALVLVGALKNFPISP
jgi:septum formation protein